MRELPLNHQRKGIALAEKAGVFWSGRVQQRKASALLEPTSVLDQRSPSPPTSTSTLSLTDIAGVAAISDKGALKWNTAGGQEGARKEDWAPELHPVPASLEMDWDAMLSESPGQEQSFLRWIMGDIEDPAKPPPPQQQQQILSLQPSLTTEFDAGATHGFGLIDPGFGLDPNASLQLNASQSLAFPPAAFFHEPAEEKSQYFGSNLVLNQFQQTSGHVPQNQALFFPSASPDILFPELFSRGQLNQSLHFPNMQSAPYHLQQQALVDQQQALVDQLFKAAELVETGDLVGAHGILARLNQQLPSSIGKQPFLRSAFYFKEALQLIVSSTHRTPFASPLATPLDVVLKLSAYKAFSEVSPILQFTNFTATQAILEELGTADCIHIIDFDIGVGGQWSSFMQELSQRRASSSSALFLLKITAFVSPHAFHPLELHITKENLSHFAADLNIPFEISIASIESFDPAEILVLSAGSNEAVAVNLPVGVWQGPSFPTILRLVKQLLPKIVVSVDQGCDRGDLLFSHYLLHALQSSIVLLDSVDAAGADQDVANKIERFVLQPRIQNCVLGRHRAAEKMLPWRTLFASAGFVPVQFSNFTETQAECLMKRLQVRGFHVEKRHAALHLYWQRGELASVSAWRY